MIAKQTLLTTQLTLSGCVNSKLRKCVTLVVSTKSCFYAVCPQNTRRLPGLDKQIFNKYHYTKHVDQVEVLTSGRIQVGMQAGRINERESHQVKVVTTRPGLPLSFFQPDLFSRPGCLGSIMKYRVNSVFFEVINSSATSLCSII